MTGEADVVTISDIADVTDFVASGSFASLAENVKYQREASYAVLVRLVDFNADWSGGFVYVDENSYNFLHKSNLEPGDIVIANVGANAGSVFRVPDLKQPMTLGPNAILVRPKDRSPEAKRFLYFYLSSQIGQHQIHSIVSGSAQPKFNKTDFRRLEIMFPALPEQRAIANVLSSLDDKIALNRQINQTLEQMVQALFQAWFVDFEPVKAKVAALAEGRTPLRAAMCTLSGKTDDELYEMPREAFDALAATAGLFPEGMEASALGAIPQGWEVKCFSDTVEILGGGTPKTSIPSFWGGDIPWFSVVDAPTESDVFTIDTEKKITQAGLDSSSARLLPEGTTIISARGTVGKLALTGVPMVINQSCYGLYGKKAGAVFTFFSTKSIVSALKQRTHGSVFDTITRETLAGVDIIAPSKITLTAFEAIAEPLIHRIKTNLEEALSLATLRDALLPKLLSGELVVTPEGN